MQVFVDRFIDGSITYENALSGITELSNSIKNGYTSLEELNGLMNIDGLESMAGIAGSVENQINESVSMLAEYIDVAKINNDAISAYTQTWEEMSQMIDKQLEALKKAAEALEKWVAEQKYNHSDSDSDGDNIDYTNNTSSGTITTSADGRGYDNPDYSDTRSFDDDDDEFHVGIEKGTIGKAKRSRVDFLKEIATKKMKPGERYIKALDTEVVLTKEQQGTLMNNFMNLSSMPVSLVKPIDTSALKSLNSRANEVNINIGDLILPDVRDVDKFAKEMGSRFNLLMAQALGER